MARSVNDYLAPQVLTRGSISFVQSGKPAGLSRSDNGESGEKVGEEEEVQIGGTDEAEEYDEAEEADKIGLAEDETDSEFVTSDADSDASEEESPVRPASTRRTTRSPVKKVRAVKNRIEDAAISAPSQKPARKTFSRKGMGKTVSPRMIVKGKKVLSERVKQDVTRKVPVDSDAEENEVAVLQPKKKRRVALLTSPCPPDMSADEDLSELLARKL